MRSPALTVDRHLLRHAIALTLADDGIVARRQRHLMGVGIGETERFAVPLDVLPGGEDGDLREAGRRNGEHAGAEHRLDLLRFAGADVEGLLDRGLLQAGDHHIVAGGQVEGAVRPIGGADILPGAVDLLRRLDDVEGDARRLDLVAAVRVPGIDDDMPDPDDDVLLHRLAGRQHDGLADLAAADLHRHLLLAGRQHLAWCRRRRWRRDSPPG